MTSFDSKLAISISVPEAKNFTARFKYSYFTIDETIDETATYSHVPQDSLDRFGRPREVILEFSAAETLAINNQIGKKFIEGFESEIFGDEINPSSELQKITSEVLLQSNGFVKFTSDIQDVQRYVLSEAGAPAVSSQVAFFAMGSDPEENKFIKSLANGLRNQTPTYINPSTGIPTTEGLDSIPDAALQTLVASDFCYDLLEASATDPYSIFSQEQVKSLQVLENIQYETRQLNNPTDVNIEEYYSYVEPLDGDYLEGDSSRGLGILGYVIFKTEIMNDERIAKNTLLVKGLSATSIIDPYVSYGKTYEYNLHPLCVLRLGDVSGDAMNLLLIGSNYRQIKLKCIEKVPPPPVNSMLFEYLGGNRLKVKWSMPTQINEAGGPIGDVKGYQLFFRNSIKDRFKLLRYFDFNDASGRYKIPETIPENYVVRSEVPVTETELFLDKDKVYIMSMCTIDAHGNSSNYCGQYSVRIDSLTNRLLVNFVSYPGAPKQYPNFMISQNMFKDSMTVSEAKRVTVFYKPKVTSVEYNNITEKVAISSQGSINDDSQTPVYRMQLIDVNTQKDKVVDISVSEK